MKLSEKLKLVNYCIGFYEYGLKLKLSDESSLNIYNLVMNDNELDEIEKLEEEFLMVYVQLMDIELAECVVTELEFLSNKK